MTTSQYFCFCMFRCCICPIGADTSNNYQFLIIRVCDKKIRFQCFFFQIGDSSFPVVIVKYENLSTSEERDQL